jgi:hypothetical protein
LLHLIREAHRVTQRLEKCAYQAVTAAERARRAQQEQDAPQRRRGAPPKVKVELLQAIAQLDHWEWLFGEIRQAIEPINTQGGITSAPQARQTVTAVVELLTTLGNATIQAFTERLLDKLDELLAPLEWLEQTLTPWRERLDPASEALVTWAWQHRQELGLPADQILSAHDQVTVLAVWEALSLFHRSPSLAESLHSWLRPYLQIHRGIPC